MTLLLLLAYPPWEQHNGGPFSKAVTASYAVASIFALLVDAVLLCPFFWVALAVLHFSWIAFSYWAADNHHYMEGYWILTIAIALSDDNAVGSAVLVSGGNALIGGCFILAFLAKLSNASFRDGSFFTYCMIYDPRFGFSRFLTGNIDEIRARHATARALLYAGSATTAKAWVPPRLKAVAAAFTWWTLVVEFIIGLMFIIQQPQFEDLRLWVLVVFCVTTYMAIPVVRFNTILLLIGIAVASDHRFKTMFFILILAMPLVAASRGILEDVVCAIRLRGKDKPISVG